MYERTLPVFALYFLKIEYHQQGEYLGRGNDAEKQKLYHHE
jgi:hypothetical protein